jgi:hypothetical protein
MDVTGSMHKREARNAYRIRTGNVKINSSLDGSIILKYKLRKWQYLRFIWLFAS